MEDLAAHLRGHQAGDWRTRWTELTSTYQDLARDLT
jgi:hypothetical protein